MTREEIGLEDTQRFLQNDSDPSSVRFSDEKKIAFNGLTKEEIMKYGSDPAWVKARWILFILFWIVWFGMLIAAIFIVIQTPKCPYKPKQLWWEKEAIYQIDAKYFKDNNNDGVGDFPGLISKLGYFENIGIKTLCLRSDIFDTDPKKIKPEFGSDLKDLRKALDSRDMHLIIDIPVSKLENNDKETIIFWLTDYVDGIRVTETDKVIDVHNQISKYEKWIQITQEVYDKTFKPKFITFYPYPAKEHKEQPSLKIDQTLLNVKQSDLSDQSFFISILKQLKNANSFILGEFDKERIKDRINTTSLSLYYGLVMLLKGTPILLYGDELEYSKNDKYMKWDKSISCGFSGNFSTEIKCDNSIAEAFAHSFSGEISLLNLIKTLLKLRQEPSFSWGELKLNENVEENVISYVREAEGFDGYLVAANTDSRTSHLVDFKSRHNITEKATAEIYYSVNHAGRGFKKGTEISTDNIKIEAGEFLVLKFTR